MTVTTEQVPSHTGPDPAVLAPTVERVNRFRLRQASDGTVADPVPDDTTLLREIRDGAVSWYRDHGFGAQADALDADVEGWVASGLDTPPDFGRSRDALVAPADGEAVFFLAPVLTTNSVAPVGRRLDCFLALRREPRSLPELAEHYPHPKNNCQATILLTGSDGFARGNCIVFFPENVAAHDKVDRQAYAIFFFSKFRRIHETLALPAARAVLATGTTPTASSGMDPDTCYEARSVWGYLHDYFHHQGDWPFDEHIALKSNWFVGLLEETKVDCRTALAAARDPEVPFADAQIDMIVLERMFRYPQAPDATRNFDAGTGVLLFSWLRERGALAGEGGAGEGGA
ncbi:MAG: DUF6421 family protein, partial [Pseudonocardia sediminis]